MTSRTNVLYDGGLHKATRTRAYFGATNHPLWTTYVYSLTIIFLICFNITTFKICTAFIYSANSQSVLPAALGKDSKVSLSSPSVVSDYASAPSLHFFINFILNKPSTVGWDTTMCQKFAVTLMVTHTCRERE